MLYAENATLKKCDRLALRDSLCHVPLTRIHWTDMSVQPEVFDLTEGESADRAGTRDEAVMPGLTFMSCNPETSASQLSSICHHVRTLHDRGRGFVVSLENCAKSPTLADLIRLCDLPDVSFTPLEISSFGLASRRGNVDAGVISNTPGVVSAFLLASKSVLKRHSQGHELVGRDLLAEITQRLDRRGRVSRSAPSDSTVAQVYLTGNATDSDVFERITLEVVRHLESEASQEVGPHVDVFSADCSAEEIQVVVTEAYPSTAASSGSVGAGGAEEPASREPTGSRRASTAVSGEDLDEEPAVDLSEDFRLPTVAQQQELLKLHRNLGHPPPNEFGRALRHAGAHRNVIRWAVRDMVCPACEGRAKPSAKRPGALPRCLRFNQVIGADLVEFNDGQHRRILLNVVCWGTGYQMAQIVSDKTSCSTRDAFAECWVKHYGWPELVVTDQGPEFIGQEFSLYLGGNGCLQHTIDSQSPWQQGRTERAGGLLKDDLLKVIEDCAIVTEDDFNLALASALDARNRFTNRSGYSAHQRVFGSSLRLPGCLLSDDPIDRAAVSSDPSTEFERAAEIRKAAQQALFRHSDKSAVQRAALARSRVQPKYHIREGDIVFVWRNSPRAKIRGWVGPGVAVCINPKQTSVWVSTRGVWSSATWTVCDQLPTPSIRGLSWLVPCPKTLSVMCSALANAGMWTPLERKVPLTKSLRFLTTRQLGPRLRLLADLSLQYPKNPHCAWTWIRMVLVVFAALQTTGPRETFVNELRDHRASNRDQLHRPNAMSASALSPRLSEPASEPTAQPDASGTSSDSSSSSSSDSDGDAGSEQPVPAPADSATQSGFASSFYGAVGERFKDQQSTYECLRVVLGDCHDTYEAAMAASGGGSQTVPSAPAAASESFFGETTGSMEGYEQCIALDETTGRLTVMLTSSGDASLVDYRHLDKKDRALFNGARKSELEGLFGLKAYELLSVEESEAFRKSTPEYISSEPLGREMERIG